MSVRAGGRVWAKGGTALASRARCTASAPEPSGNLDPSGKNAAEGGPVVGRVLAAFRRRAGHLRLPGRGLDVELGQEKQCVKLVGRDFGHQRVDPHQVADRKIGQAGIDCVVGKLTRSLKSTESGAGAPDRKPRQPHHHQSQRWPSGSCWGGRQGHGCQSRTTSRSGRRRRRNTGSGRMLRRSQPRTPRRKTSRQGRVAQLYRRRQIHHGPSQRHQRQPERPRQHRQSVG